MSLKGNNHWLYSETIDLIVSIIVSLGYNRKICEIYNMYKLPNMVKPPNTGK